MQQGHLLKLRNYAINQIIKRAITVSPKTTLLDARSMLLRHRISRLVVAENGKPVGIITEKDLVKAIYRIDGKSIENIRVSEIVAKRRESISNHYKNRFDFSISNSSRRTSQDIKNNDTTSNYSTAC